MFGWPVTDYRPSGQSLTKLFPTRPTSSGRSARPVGSILVPIFGRGWTPTSWHGGGAHQDATKRGSRPRRGHLPARGAHVPADRRAGAAKKLAAARTRWHGQACGRGYEGVEVRPPHPLPPAGSVRDRAAPGVEVIVRRRGGGGGSRGGRASSVWSPPRRFARVPLRDEMRAQVILTAPPGTDPIRSPRASCAPLIRTIRRSAALLCANVRPIVVGGRLVDSTSC